MGKDLKLFIGDNKPALIIGVCIGVALGVLLVTVLAALY